MYFRTPEMGYRPGDTQVWSQGEPELHRYWYPGYDYPNQRFTSEVICHVPEGMKVVSNGSLVSQAKGADGLVAWHWKQNPPHPNYLVALAAGFFHAIEDKLGGLPLAILVPPFIAKALEEEMMSVAGAETLEKSRRRRPELMVVVPV